MILGPIATQNPFSQPDLVWRAARFGVGDETSLTYGLDPSGPIEITLPPALGAAVAKRRSEFLAGRLCAALALRAAGKPETVGQNGRAPVWPKGVAGSISHSDSHAMAVVSLHHASVGVDCEVLIPAAQAADLHPMILAPAEAALRPQSMTFAAFLTVVFSAKESLYKALAAQLPKMPEFLDVRVTGFSANQLHLSLLGQDHVARYVLSDHDCTTLVTVAK